MLDQNTDRMWYVIGAVIIGAAIILILNNTFPQLFASIGETFKDKTEQTTEIVDGIMPNGYAKEARDLFEASSWEYSDFLYDGVSLLGFSDSGWVKYNEGERRIAVPDKNPTTHEYITKVGEHAFMTTRFSGDFKAPLLEEVGDYAFHGDGIELDNLNMDGVFYAPNITFIGSHAFDNNAFTGEFYVPKVTHIGSYAFQNAQFTGTPTVPSDTIIGENAFSDSLFDGPITD